MDDNTKLSSNDTWSEKYIREQYENQLRVDQLEFENATKFEQLKAAQIIERLELEKRIDKVESEKALLKSESDAALKIIRLESALENTQLKLEIASIKLDKKS